MGILDRVLTILNEIIILLWQILRHTFFVLIPRPLRRLIRYAQFGLQWILATSWRLTRRLGALIAKLAYHIALPFIRFQAAFQEVMGATVEKVRNIQMKDLTPMNIVRFFIGGFLFIFQSFFYLWKKSWGDTSNAMVGAICSLVVISIIAGWQIFEISEKLYVEIAYGGRKPASTFEQETKLKRRPDYYKQELRYYDIKQVRIPVYIETERSIKIFEVDITIESSNRFVRRFFSENENLIRDRMLSTTEPMVHRFPLSDEGKLVMKEKITNELNHFIKENNMEGEVRQVYFNSIVAL